MATKTYRISKPCNNFSFVLQDKGGNRQRYVFTGGSVLNNVPARLVLETQYSQDLLEKSAPFKDGYVKLERVDNGGETAVSGLPADTPKTTVPEVDSPEKLLEWVATELEKPYQQPKAALAYAEKQGYVFPNLTIE